MNQYAKYVGVALFVNVSATYAPLWVELGLVLRTGDCNTWTAAYRCSFRVGIVGWRGTTSLPPTTNIFETGVIAYSRGPKHIGVPFELHQNKVVNTDREVR